ncbi:MAG: sulfotransferase, partial [Planctomycetota bacterium]
MTGDPAPITFIRGTGRCGTTMLLRQLARHPQIAALPLDEVLPEELLDWCDRRLPGAGAGPDVPAARACRAFLEAYGRATAGAGALLHKGTMKAHHLGRLLADWPEARMVYLVRHPLGVVPSLINADIHRFRGRFGYRATVANSVLRWSNDIIAYLGSPAHGHPRVLQVSYESLVTEPDATLARIHCFMDVAPRPWVEIAGRDRYDRPFELRDDERAWIAERTGDLVRQLGLPQPSCRPPASDAERAHPDRHLGPRPAHADAAVLLATALDAATALGYRRVALFGAGYLAHLLAPRLDERHAAAVAFVDEDPARIGATIGGRPVVRPDEAGAIGVDAAVPLTLVHQAALLRRWARLHPSVPVVPLWPEEPWMDDLPARTAASA